MPDWTKSMQQTFEYYTVDPLTWKDDEKIATVISSKIERDEEAETKGSASFNVNEKVGECYIRIYLVTNQNGIAERFPLGTFLVQTPSATFDGKVRTITMDAYTPLLELKENPPPLGYHVPKNTGIMKSGYEITAEHVRAPVIEPKDSSVLYSDFVANIDDNWCTFVADLVAKAKYEIGLDDLSRVVFLPVQETSKLQPVAEFNDGNSSILYPEVTEKYDLYGIPNVVEVVYTSNYDSYYVKVTNDDPSSPTSTVSRGREIIYRDTNPSFTGEPSHKQIEQYAKSLLEQLSTVEYQVTFSHGYYPVRLGDCVLLNYESAGIKNVKAKIIKQTITCETGCKVTEVAVYTTQLWG